MFKACGRSCCVECLQLLKQPGSQLHASVCTFLHQQLLAPIPSHRLFEPDLEDDEPDRPCLADEAFEQPEVVDALRAAVQHFSGALMHKACSFGLFDCLSEHLRRASEFRLVNLCDCLGQPACSGMQTASVATSWYDLAFNQVTAQAIIIGMPLVSIQITDVPFLYSYTAENIFLHVLCIASAGGDMHTSHAVLQEMSSTPLTGSRYWSRSFHSWFLHWQCTSFPLPAHCPHQTMHHQSTWSSAHPQSPQFLTIHHTTGPFQAACSRNSHQPDQADLRGARLQEARPGCYPWPVE